MKWKQQVKTSHKKGHQLEKFWRRGGTREGDFGMEEASDEENQDMDQDDGDKTQTQDSQQPIRMGM
jgi:hypothetical protein